MTVRIYYPEMDGTTRRAAVAAGGNESWAEIKGNGTHVNTTQTVHTFGGLTATTTSNKYGNLYRTMEMYDTSDLGSGASITDASIFIVGWSKEDGFVADGYIQIVVTDPDSDDDVVIADHQNYGTDAQATARSIAGLSVDQTTHNEFVLTGTGEGNISLTGITKFGARFTHDISNTDPGWASNLNMYFNTLSRNEAVAGDKRPYLSVTGTDFAVAFTPKAIIF
jgi:hypothetical protein